MSRIQKINKQLKKVGSASNKAAIVSQLAQIIKEKAYDIINDAFAPDQIVNWFDEDEIIDALDLPYYDDDEDEDKNRRIIEGIIRSKSGSLQKEIYNIMARDNALLNIVNNLVSGLREIF